MMERLTTRHYDGTGSTVIVGDRTCSCDATVRLAAYEDTGLEPYEIQLMAEILRAERDGRLVVLPCKKGDTLWSYYDYPTWGISKILVTAVSTLDGITVINTDNYGVLSAKDIGDTVFLTREEAEAALKKKRRGRHENLMQPLWGG